MEILLQHLEASKGEYEYSGYKHITTSINNAWMKLNDYYQCTETSPVYVATVILNLQLKQSFFEQQQSHQLDWIVDARKAIEWLWTIKYKNQESVSNLQNLSGASSKGKMDIFKQFLNIPNSRLQSQYTVNKYEEYCYVKSNVHAINII